MEDFYEAEEDADDGMADIDAFEGNLMSRAGGFDGASSSEEDAPSAPQAPAAPGRPKISGGRPVEERGGPKGKDELIEELKEKVQLLSQSGSDANQELKNRLLELSKRNRKLQVAFEGQKARLAELRSSQTASNAAGQSGSDPACGDDGYRTKFVAASNELQQERLQSQSLKRQVSKFRKVLLKELGSEAEVDRVLQLSEDPECGGWIGRGEQIDRFRVQVRELKSQLHRASSLNLGAGESSPPVAGPGDPEGAWESSTCGGASECSAAVGPPRVRRYISSVAEERRKERERLSQETSQLTKDRDTVKQKLEASRSRIVTLERTTKDLKSHIETLLKKSDGDDELILNLRSVLAMKEDKDQRTEKIRARVDVKEKPVPPSVREQQLQEKVDTLMRELALKTPVVSGGPPEEMQTPPLT